MSVDLEGFVAKLVALAVRDGDGGLRRLPPERDLSDALGYTRGAIREHLTVLERLGFLLRVQGRGTFLQVPEDAFVRSYFAVSQELGYLSHQHFADSRRVLEETIAAEAAAVASEEDTAGLRGLVDKMVEATRNGEHEAATVADFAFHQRLFKIVDNPVLTLVEMGLSHVLEDSIRERRLLAVQLATPSGDAWPTDVVHYSIVDAITDGDETAARAAMRSHFKLFSQLSSGDAVQSN
jgi:GntR family transcriptional repressor for pyruvate dehydrogenase complex